MWRLSILITCCIFSLLYGKDKTICLNMIVKDEKDVIVRSLQSVLPLIDTWVIVDTGSTDGTQEIIKNFLKDIPGELHERPWKNFAYNRNEALDLAKNKGDYLLMIDADEQLEYAKDFVLPPLKLDYYLITVRVPNSELQRYCLINNHLDWRWEGVLHEHLQSKEAKTFALLSGVVNLATSNDGNRAKDPKKYLKDAKLLEEALREEPNNTRYLFYLAQSYAMAGEFPEALEAYQKRVEAKRDETNPEIFWSFYMMGQLEELLKKPPEVFLQSYYNAFYCEKNRAEPLAKISHYYLRTDQFILAYALSKFALSLPPAHYGFIDTHAYDFVVLFTLGTSAAELGKFDEAIEAYTALLQKDLCEEYRNIVKNHLEEVNKNKKR